MRLPRAILVAGVALGINSEMAFLQSFVICQSWRNELFRIMDRSKATYLCIHRCTKYAAVSMPAARRAIQIRGICFSGNCTMNQCYS